MCIACEMGFWDMVEQLPPETRERILREEEARLSAAQNAAFNCDAPEEVSPKTADETKP